MNESQPPIVSYIVITMNRPHDLAICLESLRRQSFPSSEIIVVDNCSTDDTLEILARDFSDVRVVALKENRGVSGGRNAGVEIARGEICIFIDDDAWFAEPAAAAKTVAYFDADQSLACVAYTIHDSKSGVEEMKSIPRRDKKRISEDYETTYFCGAGFALRRRPFVDVGMFWDPLVYGSQEIDVSYRFLESGWKLIHSASIVVKHKSSPLARPSGQWVYFNARDRPWVALRNLPWSAVVTTTVLWWLNAFLVAWRGGELNRFAAGVRDSVRGVRMALKERKRIQKKTVLRLQRLSGRYWF
ncbi:glycosyltransferase [bacterium]|nr:glycosyltransferase [bacterium]